MEESSKAYLVIEAMEHYFTTERTCIPSNLHHKHLLLCNSVLQHVRILASTHTLEETLANLDNRLMKLIKTTTKDEPTEVYDTTVVDTYFAFKLLCQI